ncbi:pilus assembly protein CpaE [Frigoribacterium sp. CFBP 13712]|uniref:pilus assembly protein CpaE n=1 Tax=Frigoribacterium sp. CFBP 13712 TaxID=2775309 RepID=UPI001784E860|nr:pilus assembly protein CpaE [Frigoribacterium sp. CFBP 13712]MBD8704737.1 pilus assembly protein CpaE [Frigoribacterium sp. CFBP 13712]
MLDVTLARRLHDAGLRWHPTTGDRFVIDRGEFVGDVFTISEMTIEAHEYPTGTVLGFNGTTEWALDSVAADQSLWLPREDQLRALLARSFRSLTRASSADGDGDGDGSGDTATATDVDEADPTAERIVYEVRVDSSGGERVFRAADPEDAYAAALLAYIDASLSL